MRFLVAALVLFFSADAMALVDCRMRQFATAVERDARTDKDCTIGYAHDDDTFKLRANGSWTGVSPGTSVSGAAGGVLDNTGAAWRFKEGAQPEDLLLTAGVDTWTFSSTTSAALFFTPEVSFATKLLLSDGAWIDQSANNKVSIDENSETLEFTFAADSVTVDIPTAGTDVITITPATTITGLATATGGLTTTKPLFLYDSIRFCGNGSNATTAWYLGPVTVGDAYGANFTTGGAACDANDSGTEATADEPPFPYVAYKIVGMMCSTEAGGADDVNTFQLRDDTADVTGVVCTVTNDGANPKTCSVILTAPVTVAAGSTLAVKNTNATDDDMSAKDAECIAYYTY
jgi:hypothetical protein